MGTSLGKPRQEFSRYTLTIHDNTLEVSHSSHLLIARENGWESYRQMIVPTMVVASKG